jgi:hypothetical protein
LNDFWKNVVRNNINNSHFGDNFSTFLSPAQANFAIGARFFQQSSPEVRCGIGQATSPSENHASGPPILQNRADSLENQLGACANNAEIIAKMSVINY